ncbi:hypothetical protein Cantr_10832 [Candida viswanathii]|uniref:AMP-activated protein kinase glycogen-binding domain-containing protein n=1 Tax=Candida viswanathii TaxID=5486 RepID=A0A367YDF3_9ASCO|nr:hypothetical protein Cantr_10832 [Candida viswanathii]
MSLHYTFTWPAGPQEVILTGTFDDWSQSLPLVKQTDGSFSLEVPLPGETDDITYKYVVDGEWKVNPEEATTKDDAGNENNVIVKEQLHELTAMPGAFVPESGLAAATATGAGVAGAAGAAAGASSNSAPADGELKTTVMPKEEPHHASVAGEPGIFVPKDKEALSAFEKIEDTDVKALNENVTEVGTANAENNGNSAIPAPTTGVLVEGSELTPEERKKQKKKIKRSQYKAKKKKKAAEAKGVNGEATAGSSEFDSEDLTPEATAKDEVDGDAEKSKLASTGFVAGAGASAAAASAALTQHSATPGSTTHANDVDSKTPAVSEPTADGAASTTAVVDAPVANSTAPVVNSTAPVVNSTAPVVNGTTPAVEETKAETAAPIDGVVDGSAPAVEAKESPKTLDPKVALDNEAKEVDASPVHKEPIVVSQDDEEIVIAAAGENEKEISAAVGGDVTLEEIEPTASQKEKLTKEAKLNNEGAAKKAETPAKKTATPAKGTPAKGTPAKATPAAKTNGKAEEKKKGGFRKMLKKIFT